MMMLYVEGLRQLKKCIPFSIWITAFWFCHKLSPWDIIFGGIFRKLYHIQGVVSKFDLEITPNCFTYALFIQTEGRIADS